MFRQGSSTRITVHTVQAEQQQLPGARSSRLGPARSHPGGTRPPTQPAPWWRDSLLVVLCVAAFLAAFGLFFLNRLQRSFDLEQEHRDELEGAWGG